MNISTEVCRGCGFFMDDVNCSNAYPGFCVDCAKEVIAFRPNAEVDEWFFVTEDEDLPEPVDVPSSDQCGMCGNSFFRAENRGPLGVVVTCVGGDYADGFIEGCGMSRTTHLMPAYQVIF